MWRPRIPRFAAGRRFVAGVFIGPAQRFVQTEAASGVTLLAATVVALIWANSRWDGGYHDLLEAHLTFDFALVTVHEDVLHLVNDGLMAIFFFVVGLEIKRELLHGELASRRKAALPVAAALGGMATPALIYAGFNAGGDGARGWGIPMATDTAFALGVLAILGRRVRFPLKVFVLALAIVDDLCALAVIAVFYTDDLHFEAIAWAVVVVGCIVVASRAGVRNVDVYVILGGLLWLAIFKSGFHGTLAGVVLAALTPARAYYPEEELESSVRVLFRRFREAQARGDLAGRQDALLQAERLSRDTAAPLERLEHLLHPWTSYLVVPIFALANAGIPLSGEVVRDAASSAVSLGVTAGLVLGKPIGILLFAWIACRLGVADLPDHVRMAHIAGAGLLCGIGFTVSIFIAGLAFDAESQVVAAKLGILAASVIAGIGGFIALWLLPGQPESA